MYTYCPSLVVIAFVVDAAMALSKVGSLLLLLNLWDWWSQIFDAIAVIFPDSPETIRSFFSPVNGTSLGAVFPSSWSLGTPYFRPFSSSLIILVDCCLDGHF